MNTQEQPQITTTKKTTFTTLQLAEALNTVYPDLKIRLESVKMVDVRGPSTHIEFEWTA